MKKSKQTNVLMVIIMQVIMILGFMSQLPQTNEAAVENEPIISKTAKPVEGMVNQWDVTLKVENLPVERPVDVVLVVDISSSMKSAVLLNGKLTTRMEAMRAGITTFTKSFLARHPDNRIAIVPFSDRLGTIQSFSHSQTEVVNYINKLQVFGATHIQTGLNKAKELLKAQPIEVNGKKVSRNIILVSDGVPNISFLPKDKNDMLPYVNGIDRMDMEASDSEVKYYTKKTIGEFDYANNAGIGGDPTLLISNNIPDININPAIKQQYPNATFSTYYSHINSTIAEASIIKNSTHPLDSSSSLVDNIFSIGLDKASLGAHAPYMEETLSGVSTSGDYFSVTSQEFASILDKIERNLNGLFKEAVIHDPIATGFTLEGEVSNQNASHGTVTTTVNNNTKQPELTWKLDNLKSTDYQFSLTYRLSANQAVLGEGIIDSDGLAETNGITTFTYVNSVNEQKEKQFIVPKVRPIIVSLEKELLNETGKKIPDSTKEFNVKLGEDEFTTKDNYQLLANNQVVRIVHPWKANVNYSVTETLQAGEEYETTIKVNNQTTSGLVTKFKFASTEPNYTHQHIIVTNQQILRVKQVKLNVRQVVLNPNEDLVIPTSGYMQLAFDQQQEPSYFLLTGSTLVNEANNITQELFTHQQLSLKNNKILELSDIVPEYYDLYGYLVTSEDGKLITEHVSDNPTLVKNKPQVILDYSEKTEYWITFFIEPKLSPNEKYPRPYSWDYRVNKFNSVM
ncbi:vWA domain-containing protein [Vagococcus zengguangii]|uniref:VWA domain-containing protein n=1 Tax=Vagococcus zengguangii TaxID=2571750 RepID=A0A4D7CU71_9ENTE|nr:vWA domain-containing protein [Vagococcus zengguangii]QCI85927.1 VWA domain-containing protein [Vagococcus zengguangii]TLG78321.1 VWA domain-containing protein [Vagococcus zengguangii]